MKNDKGFYDMQQPMKKTQPAKLSDREREGQRSAQYNGQPKNYETGAFGTDTSKTNYHNYSQDGSSFHGNFAQKDAHIKTLKERGQEGQYVRHWSGTKGEGEFQRGSHGNTAYPSSPIPEVYQPGTSNGAPVKGTINAEIDSPSTFKQNNAIDNTTDAMKKKKKA